MLHKLIKIFSSLKTTLALFILISAVSAVGTVINKGETYAQYNRTLGHTAFEVLYRLGILNIYESWYFILLVVLLLANLTVCSIYGLPKALKAVLDGVPPFDSFLDKKSPKSRYYDFKVSGNADEITAKAKTLFSMRFGKPAVVKQKSGNNELHFSKNGISRLSPYIVHLSIIIVIAGVALNFIYGFKLFANIREGQTIRYAYPAQSIAPVKLPFGVTLDRYTVKRYRNGAPESYISKISIVKKHVRIFTDTARGNHPMHYGGLNFYQIGYGNYMPPAVKLFIFSLKNISLKHKPKKRIIYAEPGKMYKIGINGKIIEFTFASSNFSKYVSLYNKDGKHTGNIKFVEIPVRRGSNKFILSVAKNGSIAFMLAGIRHYYFNRIEIAKNPYMPVIWTGSVIFLFGIFFSFYFNYGLLLIRITPDGGQGGGSRVEIIAFSHKNLASFYRGIEKAAAELGKPV